MPYEMKKALRRSTGAKSYAQMEQQADGQKNDERYGQKQGSRQSIFEHKNWSFKQKIKMMIFLSHYHGLPDWQRERRSIHLYKQLSNFLKKSRTPEQCKNIHSFFKRKFNSLVEVVKALQRELEHQENYERLCAKYQRQIDKFQKENGLLDGIAESINPIQPIIKSRKISQKEERQYPRSKIRVKQNEESQNQKIRLSDKIKYEQIPLEYRQQQRPANRWAIECQHYFSEWLKCVSILEYKNLHPDSA